MKVRIVMSANGKWYWSLVAENGLIVADGAEGYDSRANALRAFHNVVRLILVMAKGGARRVR